MTRRGSFIYYLSAWILGCFFMSVAAWIKDVWGSAGTLTAAREAFGLLFFYFYGLVLGALPLLILAFLLRKVAALFKCKTAWHWAIFAAILMPLLVVALRNVEHLVPALARTPGWILIWLTTGPDLVVIRGWWLAIPAGAATGYFLGRFQRAFDPAQHANAGANQASA